MSLGAQVREWFCGVCVASCSITGVHICTGVGLHLCVWLCGTWVYVCVLLCNFGCCHVYLLAHGSAAQDWCAQIPWVWGRAVYVCLVSLVQ